MTSARTVGNNITDIIEWFHSQVKISLNPQHETPFIIRCMEKNATMFNESLEAHNLKKWAICESEIPVMAKMAVLLRASKIMSDYGTSQRQYWARAYRNDQCELIIQGVSNMFKAPGFLQQMAATPVNSDKVCRIFSNLGSLIVTALS